MKTYNYNDNDDYLGQQEMLQEINTFLADCLQKTDESGAAGASPASMTDEQLQRAGKVCAFWKSGPDVYPGLPEVFACMEDLASQKVTYADQAALIRAIMQFPGVSETKGIINKANLWVLRVEEEIHYRDESRQFLSDEELANSHGGFC
ncbi:hypothetical protein FY034_17335 (plasmid) [Trichlorobacter lovleyi]|uniref:hypothetical protein n=1 Tax=Trichlorobacter lovleyi TaxID=313985 RepID=UPI00223EA09D|nr:hypothetical protein [Trichlorobacter lovleyi]QOX80787.1 hypothetical protein FY034_17335 [Trichlorobacter lovleyi]